ncbi:general secretion pathway protein GspB [Tahibacter soli]|uniref:General secretion pathway protein GspB n=1 Tax=Tahibacter soli TaxID=2983605 RepID=A0A9X3YKL5_9GAMM|nr:general secretion pathway protein GspB [Tahibacter soli]MDC8014064.1 general secretion pathway protein GspB [Tahibacter soli]
MSLIHEALKKAEAQRRLGELPTFGSPVAGTRKRSSLLPVLGGLIALALGAGWWLSSRQSAGDAPAPTATADANVKIPPAGANPASAAKAKSADAPVSTAADRRPVGNPNASPANIPGGPGPINQAPASTQPPTVKEVAERESEPHPAGTNPLAPGEAAPVALGAPPAETVPNDPAGVAAKAAVKQKQNAVAAAPPQTPPQTPPAPATTAKAAAAPATLNNATTKPAAPPSAPPPAAAQAPAPAPPAAQAPAAAPPAAPAPAAGAPVAAAPPAPPLEQLPLYWQLPLNIRKDLPALKLSMHVYSPTPEQRFVVLNGNRQKEGDDLGADVRLTEIRVDGAVLEFHGQRFLVPRGGT